MLLAQEDGSAKASFHLAEGALGRVLAHLGIGAGTYARVLERAAANGSDAAREIEALGLADPRDLAAVTADVLGTASGPIAADACIIANGGAETPDGTVRHLRVCGRALQPRLFLAPPLEHLDDLAAALDRAPGAKDFVTITTPAAIADHRARASRDARSEGARLSLSADRPEWSARTVLTAWQGAAAATLVALGLLAFVLAGETFLAAVHWSFSLLLLGCTLFRLAVLLALARDAEATERASQDTSGLPNGAPPVYTVLVALYREQTVAHELVAALRGLRWPASRLDVKFVCEADDPETVAALRDAVKPADGYEILVAPPTLPRTKPKALNFALPLARGAFVVLYDAEDRPHPDQLLQAWQAFSQNDASLACLQAPLTIRNGGEGWFAALFAIEYAVLFRATLPFLARRGLPLPLGGTSNHFRREALVAAGGWDSHNVAEDADLGTRLARLGYRTDMIEAPTCEEAPIRWRDWRNQRTRWIKGWMQTWLTHMRAPRQLLRDLGLRGFLAFQLVFAGMIAASALHTAFLLHLAAAAWILATTEMPFFTLGTLVALDLVNIVLATLAFVLLARKTMTRLEWATLRSRLPTIWFYWLLVSVAGLRAFLHLCRNPHRWEKTPHGAARPTVSTTHSLASG